MACSLSERISATDTEFVTMSGRESVGAMSRFAGQDPAPYPPSACDPEFLIAMLEAVQILAITASSSRPAGKEAKRFYISLLHPLRVQREQGKMEVILGGVACVSGVEQVSHCV